MQAAARRVRLRAQEVKQPTSQKESFHSVFSLSWKCQRYQLLRYTPRTPHDISSLIIAIGVPRIVDRPATIDRCPVIRSNSIRFSIIDEQAYSSIDRKMAALGTCSFRVTGESNFQTCYAPRDLPWLFPSITNDMRIVFQRKRSSA